MSDHNLNSTNRESRRCHMFGLIEQQRLSGQTIAAFCKEQNVLPATFYYWQKRYGGSQRVSAQGPDAFIPLRIVSDQSHVAAGSFAEIVFTDGTLLRFHSPVESSYLSNILF